MTKPTIKIELELNCQPTTYNSHQELRPDYIYFLDLPRVDLRQYASVRVKITIKGKDPHI